MKYLILPLILILNGCTSADDARAIIGSIQHDLNSCQSEYKEYRETHPYTGSGFNQPDPEPEPQKPSEPQYETVPVYNITTKVGSAVCYKRNNDEAGEDIGCGMTFSDCKDGYNYRCMTDVKYKVTEERKRVEE